MILDALQPVLDLCLPLRVQGLLGDDEDEAEVKEGLNDLKRLACLSRAHLAADQRRAPTIEEPLEGRGVLTLFRTKPVITLLRCEGVQQVNARADVGAGHEIVS